MLVDSRGETLRMGPAPYTSAPQLQSACAELASSVGTLGATAGR
jgi:hypothetical protein